MPRPLLLSFFLRIDLGQFLVVERQRHEDADDSQREGQPLCLMEPGNENVPDHRDNPVCDGGAETVEDLARCRISAPVKSVPLVRAGTPRQATTAMVRRSIWLSSKKFLAYPAFVESLSGLLGRSDQRGFNLFIRFFMATSFV
jgi:hypothetical protein